MFEDKIFFVCLRIKFFEFGMEIDFNNFNRGFKIKFIMIAIFYILIIKLVLGIRKCKYFINILDLIN